MEEDFLWLIAQRHTPPLVAWHTPPSLTWRTTLQRVHRSMTHKGACGRRLHRVHRSRTHTNFVGMAHTTSGGMAHIPSWRCSLGVIGMRCIAPEHTTLHRVHRSRTHTTFVGMAHTTFVGMAHTTSSSASFDDTQRFPGLDPLKFRPCTTTPCEGCLARPTRGSKKACCG